VYLSTPIGFYSLAIGYCIRHQFDSLQSFAYGHLDTGLEMHKLTGTANTEVQVHCCLDIPLKELATEIEAAATLALSAHILHHHDLIFEFSSTGSVCSWTNFDYILLHRHCHQHSTLDWLGYCE
jgi:hypothetical protein